MLFAAPDIPPPIDPGYDGWDMPLHPLFYLQHPFMLLYHPFALLAGGLWVWMLIHCARNDPERNMWLWILFIGNVPAAVIYFLVRWLPGARFSGSSLLGRWTKGRQIPRLEVAARNIGNAHQFVELGDAYRETGKTAGRVKPGTSVRLTAPGCGTDRRVSVPGIRLKEIPPVRRSGWARPSPAWTAGRGRLTAGRTATAAKAW